MVHKKSTLKQKGFVLWMTGLSGSGKTTIALILEEELRRRGVKVERLDGDIVRESLTRDLGFSKEDRERNIERVTFVAKLLSRNGVACICSFISPYQSIRDQVRVETTNFIEVYIDASLDAVIERDVKGMYKKALEGTIPNFTGISDPFEAPAKPDIHVRTDVQTPLESAGKILGDLEDGGLIPLADLD
ncbi:MAG TPA: adenylyl-sulfate kinase [candidate division Zixibacteria bacterium]|nr:adenylyl-sulfate kinase [candidate division Zixibacteria bacterium]